MAALLVGLVAASAPAAAEAPIGTVQLQTDLVTDPDVQKALKTGFNLPEMLQMGALGTGQPPAEVAGLVETETQRLAGILRAFGYLDARVRTESGVQSGGTSADGETIASHRQLRLVAEPGPLYRIGTVMLHGALGGNLETSMQDDLELQLGRFAGSPARADFLDKIEKDVPRYLSRNSHPFANITDRQLVRDPQMTLVHLELWLDPGPVARFGPLTYTGLLRTDPKVIAPLIDFAPGDPFDSLKLDKLKEHLEDLGLFWSARVEFADHPDAQGEVALNVKVQEKSPDPQALEKRGTDGRTVTLAAIAIAGLAQAVAATRRAPRLTGYLAFVSFGLIAAAGYFAIQQVLGFLVSG
jgi:hypothetical protein